MRKTGRSILILVTLGTVLAGSSTINAQAKKVTWHRGTPKVLRGKYKTKKYGADLMAIYKINSKSTYYWASGMPIVNGYNLHYAKTSHNHYVLKYDAHRNGIFKGGKNLKSSIVKVGKNIKYNKQTYYKY
ncbi:hypothetical protein [Secundilactobacillus mixtipabuli]|uniref:Uncharacterized protein n=1 Tax=Secundilactobacillus mixtipabuli TaxID=1435342 RepID=A0A1Z5ID43_9LACO|nr:hypothetical protein [Secundilactobacillus mixtipabuli]GAW99577.1 hypothetical protein IWT30_01547 [Secundilactobacillus mixtipabuli]